MSKESKHPEQPEGFTHFPELLESVQQMDAIMKAEGAKGERGIMEWAEEMLGEDIKLSAALAQPSPKCVACEDLPGEQNNPCAVCGKSSQPSPAPEVERPEVVGYCDPNHIQRMRDDQITGFMVHEEKGVYTCEPLMTVAQHDRVVSVWRDRVRSTYVDLTRRNNELIVERDADQARVAELEKHEPLPRQFVNAVKQLCKDFSDLQNRPYMGDVYAALDGLLEYEQIPVAQAGQVPDALREAVEYLDANFLNQISSGSVLHRKLSEALAAAPAQGE